MSGPYRSIAEGLGQESLTDPYWANKEYALVVIKEVQGKDRIQQTTIYGYLGCPVKVLETADFLKSSFLEMHSQVVVITPGYLISQQYLKEGGIVHLLPPG